MKIGTLAKKVRLTPHTLRYYERIGLLPPIYRDASGQRDYDDATLQRLDFLGKMRTTGMPLRQMQHYVTLVAEGDNTQHERRALWKRTVTWFAPVFLSWKAASPYWIKRSRAIALSLCQTQQEIPNEIRTIWFNWP